MQQDNINLTEKQLKIAYFFVAKRKLLKKIIIGFLILIDILLFSFSIYHFIQYFSQSKGHEEMMKELTTRGINFSLLNQAISPLPPQIITSGAILVGQSKYHLICLVENPNPTWFIESLNYKFISSNGFIGQNFKTFILPGEKKTLVDFNESISQSPRDISCEFSEIKWQRIKPKDYNLLEISDKFLIKDLQYILPQNPEGRSITQFKFVNSSVYNFWEIDLSVILYEGNQIVALEKTKLSEVMSGEERKVKIIWSTILPFISKTEVQPEINIFDVTSFIKPNPKPEAR